MNLKNNNFIGSQVKLQIPEELNRKVKEQKTRKEKKRRK